MLFPPFNLWVSTFLYKMQDGKCITINWAMTIILVFCRTLTDFVYLLHIFLQVINCFRFPLRKVSLSLCYQFGGLNKMLLLFFSVSYLNLDSFFVVIIRKFSWRLILVLAKVSKFTYGSLGWLTWLLGLEWLVRERE